MQPSLLVLLVGGWGQAAAGPGNLFTSRDGGYFDELLATYPTVFIKQAEGLPKLNGIYRALGTVSIKQKPPLSLIEILHGHGLRVECVADADRYGLLTETLHLGRPTPWENEDWRYIPLPPSEKLADMPATSASLVVENALEAMKTEKDAVIFACLNSIWSVGLSGQLAATREAVEQTQEAVKTLVNRALDRSLRVLLIGDEGLAETYASEKLTIHSTPTDQPVPCVLIEKQLEGLSASGADQTEAIQAGQAQPTAQWRDVAPTILALMDIPPRPHTEGHVLFPEYIERLRRSAGKPRTL